VRISTPNVGAKLAIEMDVEERVFDDDEKQRAWLEGYRRGEAISGLLERHGDKRFYLLVDIRTTSNKLSNARTNRSGLILKRREEPSNVRIFLVDILTFDGFFGAKFDILTPRWLPTLWTNGERKQTFAVNRPPALPTQSGLSIGQWLTTTSLGVRVLSISDSVLTTAQRELTRPVR
jgi:hypothetical protein